MKLSSKVKANFMTCNLQISHDNEFSIKCPPIPHWLMDGPRKQEVPSMIDSSGHISEEMNTVSHQKLQESHGRFGPFAWTLFERQITNEDTSRVLSNVLFI